MKKLDHIDKTLPFTTPDGYFDELPTRLQAKLGKYEPEASVLSISWTWRRTVITAAASLVIGLLLWQTYPTKQHSIGQDALSEVSDEAIIKYVQENQVEVIDLANAHDHDESVVNDLDISDEEIMIELESTQIEENI